MSDYTMLLTHPSPILRYLVLKFLYEKPDTDREIRELVDLRATDESLKSLLDLQADNGSWNQVDVRWGLTSSKLFTTSIALQRLAYFGFTHNNPWVKKGADYLFSQQRKDGSWSLKNDKSKDQDAEGYDWLPIETAIPLQGLCASGYAQDPRCERAFQWLFEKKLTEGSWPAGWISGNYGKIAGYRKMPHSRWGCRTNTTAVLICLAYHPQRKKSGEARQALDLLLGRETQDISNIGFDRARILGFEPLRGEFTFYAKYDPLLTLWLSKEIGADLTDNRVNNLYTLINSNLNDYNLMEYKSRPEAAKWISYEIARITKDYPTQTNWQSQQPRTPFQTYPRMPKRF